MFVSLKLLLFMEALQLLAFGIFYACLNRDGRRVIRPMDVALALAIPVIGLFGHNKYVLYGFLFFVPLLSVGKPGQLVCRYLLLLPLFPEISDKIMIGSLYLLDFSAIDAFNFGALTALVLTRRNRARSIPAIDATAWIIFALSLMMQTRGIPLNGMLRSVPGVVFSIVPPFYILARLVSTRRIAQDGVLFFILGGFINAIVALFETLRHWPLYQSFYAGLNVPMTGLSATLAVRSGMLRAQGVVGDPTMLGMIVALALVAMLAVRLRFQPIGRLVIMGLLAGGMVMSQSRGAWMAAATGAALYLLFERRVALLAGVIFLSLLASMATLLAPEHGKIASLLGRSGQAQWTADYRKNLFQRGLQEVAHHPLTGQTRAQLEVSMNDMRQGQRIIDFVNTHLNVALIAGLGGLLLWLIAWFVPLTVGWGSRSRHSAHDARSPVALPFALVGACFVGLSLTSMIDRMTPVVMIAMGMMSAYVRLARTDKVESAARSAVSSSKLVARIPRTDDRPDGDRDIDGSERRRSGYGGGVSPPLLSGAIKRGII